MKKTPYVRKNEKQVSLLYSNYHTQYDQKVLRRLHTRAISPYPVHLSPHSPTQSIFSWLDSQWEKSMSFTCSSNLLYNSVGADFTQLVHVVSSSPLSSVI